jgi:hypothetical protein
LKLAPARRTLGMTTISPMSRHAPQAPPARLALVFHAPTIARLEVVYLPAAGRLARALLCLVLCWGMLPLLIWVPPHFPWAVAAFAAGIYLPFRFWTGRYRVRSFFGFCPRCGRALELRRGTKINLPHTLTCFHCHFEPVLEVVNEARKDRPFREEPIRIEHRCPDCTGLWSICSGRGPPILLCAACGARHCATPAARQAADEENRRGTLLAELTAEGRFLL